MVDIIPFCGFRPTQQLVEKVACPPYDVIESDEARQLVQGNPHSFLHVIKPEIDLDSQISVYDDQVYRKGADNLRKFVAEKTLIFDSKPCFYVYQQKMGEHIQVGLVAGVSALEYQQNIVKKHEHTREEKETDRARHVETLNANTGPVFLLYRNQEKISSILQKICEQNPVYDFFTTDDKVQHKFWVVDDNTTVREICECYQQVPALYVADGHHRSAAGFRVYESKKAQNPLHRGNELYNYFLAVIFPHDQLYIMAYNRIVMDLNGMSCDEFLTKLGTNFAVAETTTPNPPQKHQFGMFLDNKWYRLTIKENLVNESDVVAAMDASILQNYVLDPLLGIKNPRKDDRIKFVGGRKPHSFLEEQAQQHANVVAFVLYPVDVESLMAVADANRVMPPKSTWFEPKLRSGLIVKPLI